MLCRFLILAIVVVSRLSAQSASFPSAQYFRQQWTRPPLDVELTPPRLVGARADGDAAAVAGGGDAVVVHRPLRVDDNLMERLGCCV